MTKKLLVKNVAGKARALGYRLRRMAGKNKPASYGLAMEELPSVAIYKGTLAEMDRKLNQRWFERDLYRALEAVLDARENLLDYVAAEDLDDIEFDLRMTAEAEREPDPVEPGQAMATEAAH